MIPHVKQEHKQNEYGGQFKRSEPDRSVDFHLISVESGSRFWFEDKNMAYGFETSSFQKFNSFLNEYPEPEGLPHDREVLATAVALYIEAAGTLFRLLRLITAKRLNDSKRGQRFAGFLEIYDHRVRVLIEVLNQFFVDKLEQGDLEAVHEFIEGVRRGAIAEEMVLLQHALADSSEVGEDAEADTEGATTAVNSLKEQIERRVKIKWIKDILHAINEVLAITRGAM